jgi:predicted DCC family thiol-disulfide oxidoreductase YuxK
MVGPVTQENGQHLILYDGVCGLCNRGVGQILPRDPRGVFHFASLQSELARSLLRRYGRNPDLLDTIYVITGYNTESTELLSRGRAALFVIGRLETPWRFLRVFGVLPTLVLDAGYSLIARLRYRLFGKYDACRMPDSRYAGRFLDL